ncbi:MAG: hypothetical protein GTO41_24870, partial [Burkholderiales bacterium]|nr:hypothetical protein [Burkholderiales bacterium]
VRDDRIVKVEMPHRMISGNLRRQTLKDEYEIHRACAGVRGIPAVIDWKETDGTHALFLERMPGEPLQIGHAGWLGLTAATFRLAALAASLARRGVAHNDFDPTNILLSGDGSISLIDFDQATVSSQFVAIVRAFLGVPKHDALVMTSVFYLLRLKVNSTLRKMLPDSVFNFLRGVKKSLTRAKHSRSLPKLDDAATDRQRTLLKAWRIAQRSDANAPGDGLAYYEISDGVYVFPGERPWNERWEVLKQTADFRNKRV